MFFFFNDNDVEVTNISEYISKIKDIRDKLLDEGSSERLFFRGQCNANWDIRPSIFRDSLISIEEEMIEKAISRVPDEFLNCNSAFDELTKLQHYGLPTRLLDVTMNPLVALYFACCSKDKSKEDEESKGVVYYGSAYAKHCTDVDVVILSSLAKMKITRYTTLYDIKEALGLHDKNPERLIHTIQGSLFVMPKYSNNRLVSQNGAFMLVGAISIDENTQNVWKSKVQKSVHNMDSFFKPERIVIPEECKDQILSELDLLNINEASLFPELEHQMSHIKRAGAQNIEAVPEFMKFNFRMVEPVAENTEFVKERMESEDIDRIVARHIQSKEIQNIVCGIIQKYADFPDWYKKESTVSSLKIALKRALNINDWKDSKMIIEQIMSDFQNPIKP